MTGRRRWTVYEFPGGKPEVYRGEPDEGDEEGIAVMPVAEHEALVRDFIAAAKTQTNHQFVKWVEGLRGGDAHGSGGLEA